MIAAKRYSCTVKLNYTPIISVHPWLVLCLSALWPRLNVMEAIVYTSSWRKSPARSKCKQFALIFLGTKHNDVFYWINKGLWKKILTWLQTYNLSIFSSEVNPLPLLPLPPDFKGPYFLLCLTLLWRNKGNTTLEKEFFF